MLDMTSDHVLAALIGLGGGVLLGLAARLGRFCTLGAIEDLLYSSSDMRMRMWGVAIGTAIIGTFGLMASGLLVDSTTYYLSIRWMPVASVVGGLMFGYGMALAGNCGFGSIARLGGGDLRSFVIVLVMGVSAYVVLNGPLAPLRAALFEQQAASPDSMPGIAHQLGSLTGVSVHLIGITIGAAILVGSLWSKDLLSSHKELFWSVMVGVSVISGWAGTTWLAQNSFEALPVVSHSYSAPIGETMLWFMTGSARPLSFAVGSVAGVWLGAFIGSLIKGHFRWEACEDPRELRRQILGAGIMGAGAVLALGCTVGQGITAFSVLAISAPVTFLAILAGAAFGLRQLIEGFQPAE